MTCLTYTSEVQSTLPCPADREADFADSLSIVAGDAKLCRLIAAAGLGDGAVDVIAAHLTAQRTGDRSFLPPAQPAPCGERASCIRSASERRCHEAARRMIAADRTFVRKARRADIGWNEIAPLVDYVAAGLAAKEGNARARAH